MSLLIRFIIGFVFFFIKFNYKKAKKWGKIGTIETVRWIINGEDTEKTESYYFYDYKIKFY